MTPVVRIDSAVGCFEDCDSVSVVVAEESDVEGADDVVIDVTSNKDSLKILYIHVLVYTNAKYIYVQVLKSLSVACIMKTQWRSLRRRGMYIVYVKHKIRILLNQNVIHYGLFESFAKNTNLTFLYKIGTEGF